MAGSFEEMGRLERNIIDLYKYENCPASSAVPVERRVVWEWFQKIQH